MNAETRDVLPLARHNVRRFVRHAANVGRMLARLGVRLPIVTTPDGSVINGVGRLEAAARKGRKEIAVVTLDEDRAELARAMLNLLSMDFKFTGDSADFLRYGAFRRDWLRRTYLGTAFVLPVYRHQAAFRRASGRKIHGEMDGSLRGKRAGFRLRPGRRGPDASGRRHPRDHV